jgi:hypothetical protein
MLVIQLRIGAHCLMATLTLMGLIALAASCARAHTTWERSTMKRMRALLILVLVGLAAGQIPDTHRTDGFLNCRYWNANENPSIRVGIVMGHAELWDLAQRAMPGLPPLKGRSYGEMMNGITAVCSLGENGQLTIREALTLFAEKVAGETESELESRAANFRKAHATEAVSSRSAPSRPGAAPR